jgi:hypothetical protein
MRLAILTAMLARLVAGLVERALAAPRDAAIVSQALRGLSSEASPQAKARYRELFFQLPEDVNLFGMPLRPALALALLNAGEKDAVYFDEIAAVARASLASTMPPLYKYDAEGNQTHDPINPALASWCTANHRRMDECMSNAMTAGAGVMFLSETKDRKAVHFFARR